MAAIIETSIVSFCNATGTILAAFGHRITPNTIPDGQTYPHARFRVIGTDQRYHTTGEGGRKYLVQFDVYDDDEAGAQANAEIVRSAFSARQGTMGAVTTGQVKARLVTTNRNPDANNFWRIVEIEIPTND